MRVHTTAKRLVVLAPFLLVIFLAVLANNAETGNVPVMTVMPGNVVAGMPTNITINASYNLTPDDLDLLAVRIQGENSTYRYGAVEEFMQFRPPFAGTYTIRLYNRFSGTLYDEKIVVATEPETIEPLDSDAYTSRFITIDKEQYASGEDVQMTINYRIDDFVLRIVTPTTIYRLLGDAGYDNQMIFSPNELGTHEIQLLSDEGVIERRVFTVVETPQQSDTYLLNTNIKNKVRDHLGYTIDPARITILDNGRLIQSDIDLNQRYTVRIQPENLYVREVRLDNLRFDAELNLGMEEVNPSRNPIPGLINGDVEAAFALDPTRLNFTNGSFTVVAPGDQIYKCTDYDFPTQTCYGEQKLIMSVPIGSRVTIPFDAADPLYSFVNTSTGCSCYYVVPGKGLNSGQIACNQYCAVTVNGPGTGAESGFIQEVKYVVDLTIVADGTTISNGYQQGEFDHDQTRSNGNEIWVGNSTATATTTLTWTRTGLSDSGSDSFTYADCDNWPTSCSNFDAYINGSADFQAPGNSKKNPSITVALTSLNVTWNYTAAGDLSLSLNTPGTDTSYNYTRHLFNYTPSSTAPSITNCSLYTNVSGGWTQANWSDSINNGSYNYLAYTLPGEGSYKWNVFCIDSASNEKWAVANYTLLVDQTKPAIYLESPAPYAEETSSVVTFEYNVTDAYSTIANCSLYVNDSFEDSDTSITEGTTQTFASSFSNGNYSWYVVCFDSVGNRNQSDTRYFNVSTTPTIWNNTWYESSTANCTLTGDCDISLLMSTDGTTNSRQITVPSGGGFDNLLNATSPYIGDQGGLITSAATITFRSDYTQIGGTVYQTWKLYALHDDDSLTEICVSGDDSTGGTRIQQVGFIEATCNPSSDITLSGTDRLQLVINLYNDHPSQDGTLTHDWDVANSYVDIANFITVGTLSVDLIQPNSSSTVAQGELFNTTCEATCSYGTCVDTYVYAQYDSGSGWLNISSSGELILATSETNPHYLGNISGNPSTNSTNTTFEIEGNLASTNDIRCVAEYRYDSSTGPTTQVVTVGDTAPPTVTLLSPIDGNYTNSSTVTFYYNVTDTSSIANCSLYVNSTFNTTNSTPIVNPGGNNFTVTGFVEGDYNWTVSCTDTGGYIGNATETRNFSVDSTRPNVILSYPGPTVSLTVNDITFNWTSYDNRAENLTCLLVINDTINATVNATPGTLSEYTVNNFDAGSYEWYVNCTDNARNKNQSATWYFNITDTPPTVELLSPQDGSFDADGNLVLEYNASDNDGFQNCSLLFDGSYNTSNATPILNGQSNNFTLLGVGDGAHTWTVNCTDTADFSDTPATWAVTVDTVDPNVTIISPNQTTVTTSTITFQWNMTDATSPNATCEVQYNSSFSGITLLSDITAYESALSQTSDAGALDGVYDWNVTCMDLGLHYGQSTIETFNVSVSPTVGLTSPAPNDYENGASVDFIFSTSDNDGFSNCTLRLTAGPNASDTINQSPINNGGSNTITLQNLASGMHVWAVLCYDNGTFLNSYQTLGRNLFIDNGDPYVIQNFPIDVQVNVSTVEFNWSADDDQDLFLSCDIWLDGVQNKTGISSDAGDSTVSSISGLNNGLHNWSVNCTDDAGNSNMSTTNNFTVLVVPSTNLTYPYEDEYLNYTPLVTFEYIPTANTPMDNCSLYIDGALNWTNTSINPDNYNYFFADFPPGVEGTHTWNVYCTDQDGLSGGSPTNATFHIDLYGPNMTLNNPRNNTMQSNNNISFNFTMIDTISPNATCNITVEGYPEAENIIAYNDTPYATFLSFPDGNYSWYVECIDLAGHKNYSPTYNFSVYAPLDLTLLTPRDGAYVNSSSVTLTYLPEDGYPLNYCNLSVNGKYNDTEPAVITNHNNTFTLSSLSEGYYNWSVLCVDQDDHVNETPTWTFIVDYTLPNITLVAPIYYENLTTSSATFNFTANDTYDASLLCNLTVDNNVESSDIPVVNSEYYNETLTDFTDGLHYWNVTCWDNATNTNTSEMWMFNTSAIPTVNLSSPLADNWLSSTTITFIFTPSDNDGFDNCTLFLNNIWSGENTSIAEGVSNRITNESMSEGAFNWTANCIDNGTYHNTYSPSNITFYNDLYPPWIELLKPASGSNQVSTVLFNYSVLENLSPFINCTLSLDSSDINFSILTNGSYQEYSHTGIGVGTHHWNVSCVDYAQHSVYSNTWNFTIPQSDIVITTGNITFNDSSPEEGTNVTILANVYNLGNSTAYNITVQFWRGDPDSGGVKLAPDINISSLGYNENQTVFINYSPIIGVNNIFVLVDPPIATGGSINETNENNNKANNSLLVGHYEVFSGNISNRLHIDDAALVSLYQWNSTNVTGGMLLVADEDSIIDFTSLVALGRDTSDIYQPEDFTELDTQLGSTGYPDNINASWTENSQPLQELNITLFKQNINYVPFINSTNSSSFRTGILWDRSDGGTEYTGTQDIVFVTITNQSQVGYTGVYDFEFKVPATLRDYTGTDSLVTFYAEII